jgi:glucokinase
MTPADSPSDFPAAPRGVTWDRIVGLDIGGTKCAVACVRHGRVEETLRIPTGNFAETFGRLTEAVARIACRDMVIGVSCGGPLDAARGVITAPPNLDASWHGVDICRLLTERFGARAFLMNDANACALAEWHFGAGRGCRHMVFLTSGTGMGAGLILNGRLYEGASGDAGEVGHLRLASDGPIGFGKAGSFEGFCSGGGIARLAVSVAQRHPGLPPSWLSPGGRTTTRDIADAAKRGDPLALEIMQIAATKLGEALALLIDTLNPERIILGGFYRHCRELFEVPMRAALKREALPTAVAACKILPAELGDTIGSHGAIAVALHSVSST